MFLYGFSPGLVMCIWFISLRHLLTVLYFLHAAFMCPVFRALQHAQLRGAAELAEGHKRYLRITLHTQ